MGIFIVCFAEGFKLLLSDLKKHQLNFKENMVHLIGAEDRRSGVCIQRPFGKIGGVELGDLILLKECIVEHVAVRVAKALFKCRRSR